MGGIAIYLDEEDRQMAMKSKYSELDLLSLKQPWDIEIEMSKHVCGYVNLNFPERRNQFIFIFFYFN